MALVVRDAFHLDGVMKAVGDVLSGAEEKKLLDMLKSEEADIAGSARELMHRCVRAAEIAVEAVDSKLKKVDPKPEV